MLALLALVAFACARAESWVVVNGIAKHLDPGSHCHDHVTPGLGLERDLSPNWKGAVGFYDNSNCDTSAYAALIHTPLHLGRFSAGWLAGAVSGYRNSVLPAGGFAGTYEARTWGLNLIFIPPYRDSGNVLWLQAKRAW